MVVILGRGSKLALSSSEVNHMTLIMVLAHRKTRKGHQFLNRYERKHLEHVALCLDLARSYSCSADREKAILKAIEHLELVLKADSLIRNSIFLP